LRLLAPTISQIDPQSGNTDGGYPITITGTNFVPEGVDPGVNSSVALAGSMLSKKKKKKIGVNLLNKNTDACQDVTWTSDTEVVCVAPVGQGNDLTFNVTVGGQSVISDPVFSYNGCLIFTLESFLFFNQV
jgi:hypothetical protein